MNMHPDFASPLASSAAEVVIAIVGFRNAADVRGCLWALAEARGAPSQAICICETVAAAFENLLAALTGKDGPCFDPPEELPAAGLLPFARIVRCRLAVSGAEVFLGEARQNSGYAGGVNAWGKMARRDGALARSLGAQPRHETRSGSAGSAGRICRGVGKGMIGSRLTAMDDFRLRLLARPEMAQASRASTSASIAGARPSRARRGRRGRAHRFAHRGLGLCDARVPRAHRPHGRALFPLF